MMQVSLEIKEDDKIPQIIPFDQDHIQLEILNYEKNITECPLADTISPKKFRMKLQKNRQNDFKKLNSQLKQKEEDDTGNQDKDDR